MHTTLPLFPDEQIQRSGRDEVTTLNDDFRQAAVLDELMHSLTRNPNSLGDHHSRNERTVLLRRINELTNKRTLPDFLHNRRKQLALLINHHFHAPHFYPPSCIPSIARMQPTRQHPSHPALSRRLLTPNVTH